MTSNELKHKAKLQEWALTVNIAVELNTRCSVFRGILIVGIFN